MGKLHQVLTDRAQSFSEVEKAQARANIGAAAVGEGGGGGEPSPLKVFQYGLSTKEEVLEYLEAGNSARSCVVCLNGRLYTNTGYSYTGTNHLSFQSSYWTADLPEGARPDTSVIQRVKDAHMYMMTIRWDEDEEDENGWSTGPSYPDLMGGFAEGEFFIATYGEDKFSTIDARMTLTRKSSAVIRNRYLYTFSRHVSQEDNFYEYSRVVSFASDKIVLEYVRISSQDVWSTETAEVPTGPMKLFEGSEQFQWRQEPFGQHYSWMLPVTTEMVPEMPVNLDVELTFQPQSTAPGRPLPWAVRVTVPLTPYQTSSFSVNSLWQESTVGTAELRDQCAMFAGNLSVVLGNWPDRYLCIHLARMYPLLDNPGGSGYPVISGNAAGDGCMYAPVLQAIYRRAEGGA